MTDLVPRAPSLETSARACGRRPLAFRWALAIAVLLELLPIAAILATRWHPKPPPEKAAMRVRLAPKPPPVEPEVPVPPRPVEEASPEPPPVAASRHALARTTPRPTSRPRPTPKITPPPTRAPDATPAPMPGPTPGPTPAASPVPAPPGPPDEPQTGSVDGKPVLQPAPAYPRDALHDGIEGHVLVRFSVDGNGVVLDVEVLAADPPGVFDKAVTRAAGRYRFEPTGKAYRIERDFIFRVKARSSE